jgi:hypothetical protein
MKTCLALGLFAATVLSLSAQTNGAAAADPFVKKDAPAPQRQKGPVVNIVLTFEFYEVNQTQGAQLLQETSSVVRYDQLGDLVKSGKARLDALISGVQEPGQQSTLEQCETFPYAIAFQATSYNSQITLRATDFKRRNLGYRVVFKSNEAADQKGCYVNLFPEHTRLAGIVDQNSVVNSWTCEVPQPVFNTQRVNVGALLFPYGPISFVNTFNPPAPLPVAAKKGQAAAEPAEPQMGLIFARASRIQYEPTAETVEPFAPLDAEISIYSMPRELARQVLAEPPKADSYYRAVQSLVTAGQAKLEHIAVIRSPTGVKSNISEVAEKTSSTGGDDQWMTQDLGFNAEVRADLIGNGSLLSFDVTQCQFLTDLGPPQGEGLASTLAASQTIFQLQSLTTKLNSALGIHTLLGTLNRAGDTGIPGQSDDGRVWLAFIQAANAKP